jgi:PAS domain S-box-containing protein
MRFHPSLEPRDLPLLLDTLPLPLAVTDRAGRLLAANDAWQQLDPAVQPGEPAVPAVARAFPCLPPGDIEELLAGTRDALACDAPAEGGQAPARLRALPVAGREELRLLALLDATGAPDDRYRRLVDEANDIMFSLDLQGRFTEMNRLGYVASGYTPEELIGKPATAFVPPEQLPRVAAALAAMWRGETVPMLQVEFVFKNGERRWFEVRGRTLVEDGRITGTFHVARDITERHALEQARELLSQAAAAAPIVIWVVDMEGRYTLLEGGALAQFGLRPGQLVGQSIFEVYRGAPERIAEIRRGLAGEAFASINRWRGTIFESHYVPLRNAAGEQVGLMSVVLDITARVRAAEAEARADKFQSLAILAGGIAHEFNNLLVAVLGNAALTLLDLPEGSPLRPAIAEIEDAARRLAELSHQMLAFSGRGIFIRRLLSINAIVATVAQREDVSVTIRQELAPNLPGLEGDSDQLRFAIGALIENAIEASPPGGTVTVRTRLMHGDPESLAGAHPGPLPPGDYVVVEVSDEGPGIPRELHQRIFEPFFTTRFTGRGLGLATVSGVARAHHGTVVVESEPGAGATFRLYLPPAGSAYGSS